MGGKTTISNDDLNHYYEMNVKMDRGKTKKSISIAMPIIDDLVKRINGMDERFSSQPVCTGSYYQGLKVAEADEFDINIRVKSRRKKRSTKVDVPTQSSSFDDFFVPLLRKHFTELFKEARREAGYHYNGVVEMPDWRHGPAFTFKIKTSDHHPISVDFAPVLTITEASLPPDVKWPHRGANWPSEEKKRKLENMGVNFVAKKDAHWCISFGHMEHELLEDIDKDGGCRKKVMRILKSIRDEFWCQGKNPALSSYHLKNLLFWECEAHPHTSDWTQDRLAERFLSLMTRLREALETRSLPQFFQPEHNLMDSSRSKLTDGRVQNLQTRIKSLLRKPEKYLL